MMNNKLQQEFTGQIIGFLLLSIMYSFLFCVLHYALGSLVSWLTHTWISVFSGVITIIYFIIGLFFIGVAYIGAKSVQDNIIKSIDLKNLTRSLHIIAFWAMPLGVSILLIYVLHTPALSMPLLFATLALRTLLDELAKVILKKKSAPVLQ